MARATFQSQTTVCTSLFPEPLFVAHFCLTLMNPFLPLFCSLHSLPFPPPFFFFFSFQRFPALTFFSFSPPSGLFFCLPAKHLFLSFCSSALWYVNHKRFLPPHHTDASTESTTCTEQIVSARSVLRPAANRAYFWKKQLEGKTHRRCSPTPGQAQVLCYHVPSAAMFANHKAVKPTVHSSANLTVRTID